MLIYRVILFSTQVWWCYFLENDSLLVWSSVSCTGHLAGHNIQKQIEDFSLLYDCHEVHLLQCAILCYSNILAYFLTHERFAILYSSKFHMLFCNIIWWWWWWWWCLCRQHGGNCCIISCRSSSFNLHHVSISIHQASFGLCFRCLHLTHAVWVYCII